MDLFIGFEEANLSRISSALGMLGVSLTVQELSSIFETGKLPNLTGGYRTQLFPRIDGVQSELVLKTSQQAYSSIGAVPVISKDLAYSSEESLGSAEGSRRRARIGSDFRMRQSGITLDAMDPETLPDKMDTST